MQMGTAGAGDLIMTTWRHMSAIALGAAAIAGPASALTLFPPANARDLHFIFGNGSCIGLTSNVTFKCNKSKKPPQVEAAWTEPMSEIVISAGLLPADGDLYTGAEAAGKWRYLSLAAWTDGNGNYLPDKVVDFGRYGGIVPEPGVWSLMVLGFGAMGAALRRRRGVALR